MSMQFPKKQKMNISLQGHTKHKKCFNSQKKTKRFYTDNNHESLCPYEAFTKLPGSAEIPTKAKNTLKNLRYYNYSSVKSQKQTQGNIQSHNNLAQCGKSKKRLNPKYFFFFFLIDQHPFLHFRPSIQFKEV